MFIINSVIYWFIYIVKSFIEWDLSNPFQWILDLPYDYDLRVCSLGILFFDIVFVRVMVIEIFLAPYLNKIKS